MKYPIILLLTLLASSCGKSEEAAKAKDAPEELADSAKKQEEPEAAPDEVILSAEEQRLGGVRLGGVSRRALGQGLKVNGVLDVPPDQLASVSAPLGGFVDRTALLQGTRVRKGEVLATIRNPDFAQLQQDYLETRSQLTYAKAEYERQAELYRQEVAPQKNYQKAQAEYQGLQAKAAALAARLRATGLPVGGTIVTTTALRAPVSGFVKTVNVTVGQSVTPTDVLFEIVDPEHLHVELTVFEKDVPQLHKNQLVRFSLSNDAPGTERTARVYLISRAISAERTVRVHAHLDQEDHALLPGTFVRAIIETNRATLPTVPEKAVVQFEGRHYIYTAKGQAGHYRMVEVQPGLSEDGYIAIQLPATAAPDSARLVVEGAYSLLAKMKNAEEE
ncbi:efflux RND transporter periplasmic adaptor subunit [Hymenobacter sp.]|jgi:cobalt-zinc-cadmium efflux system membrane fusion protein|uniref:efflux RND transporter periplasmic adaptor subunit n=1 Tax=Hymenobacter sp. TaxID=1898978 RepID=UPI002ED9CD6B